MNEHIISASTKVAMAVGGTTAMTTVAGIPIGELGQFIGGISALLAFILALVLAIRSRGK